MSGLDSSWLKFWEFISECGFVLVIIGVIGEGVELIVKWDERRRGKSTPLKKLKWLLPVETISFAILVVGLAMEFLGSHNAMRIADADNARLHERAAKFEFSAAELEKQIAQTTTNVAKIDPRNALISEMTAIAWFTVMGTNNDEMTNLPSGRKAQMTLFKNEREGFSLDDLEAGGGDIFGHVWRPTIGLVDRRIYRIQLHSFNFLTALGIKAPLVKTIDDVHLVRVNLNFLPRDSQIANGRVILTVNNVTKYFDVPNQNDTNSTMGWQNDFQCWFIATNGVQSSEKQFLYLRN